MIGKVLKRIVQAGESYLGAVTSPCTFCAASVKQYAAPTSLQLCTRCAGQISWIAEVLCLHCGRAENCPDCARRERRHLKISRSAVKYDERMKEWLAAYKYRGNERLRWLFASMLYTAYKRHEREYAGTGAIEWLTYVPVSGDRLEERGFNQAAQLASGLGLRTGIPVVPLLRRSRDTGKMSYKSRSERLKDLKDVFAVDEDGIKQILKNTPHRPINIVIIDDVYTTGSTLHHCAEAINGRLDANVYGLTWAR